MLVHGPFGDRYGKMPVVAIACIGAALCCMLSAVSASLGMLTLATFTIPTGLRAWVEDVVVDGEARGQGAGQALVEAAVEHAGKLGARTVDLTSRPTREAANRLYRRAGFVEMGRRKAYYRHTARPPDRKSVV